MATVPIVTPDRWESLRSATPARIALGRAGGSLPARAWLEFKAAHAAARDAVHCDFDAEQVAAEIRALGSDVVMVDSDASDRRAFLLRPDHGRRLNERSRYDLQELPKAGHRDLAIIVSDGLSALAVHRQVPPLFELLLPKLIADGRELGPVVVARFARVAIEDEIGMLLSAQSALIFIGERPGLGSPDSLGAYLVYNPKLGNTDANRNCVSNIRPEGLPLEAAAETIRYLIAESLRRRISGVALKDERVFASTPTLNALDNR
jgi:ethanolamine ammonia-lyase small subunit